MKYVIVYDGEIIDYAENTKDACQLVKEYRMAFKSGINEVNKMEFIKDVLSRKMSLKQVCKKYEITIDDILERYQQERSKFTDEQIEVIMNEVYYQ